jgi:hypothetical protein
LGVNGHLPIKIFRFDELPGLMMLCGKREQRRRACRRRDAPFGS